MSIDWRTEYPITNTGYEQPNTQVSFMRVPWDNTYTDILDFSNLAAQTSAMNALIDKTINYMNYFKKDNAFDVAGNVADYENYNYLRYVNTNYNNKYFYCFITKVEYRTKDCTRIYVQTDVWQTWQFNLTFYQSFIERSHVAKDDDIIGANLQNEPMTSDPEYVTQQAIFDDISWDFRWLIDSLSVPIFRDGSYLYSYGGVAKNTTDFMGYFSMLIPKTGDIQFTIQNFIAAFQSNIQEINDHRNDIIQIRAMPEWAVDDVEIADFSSYTLAGDVIYNTVTTADDTVTINNTTLNNGYTPRNKKLLSSLYRYFLLYNFNGLQIPLKPELCNSNTLNLHLSTKPATAYQIRLTIGNYNDYKNTHIKIPYQYTMGVAYNENTGLNSTLSKLSAVNTILGGFSTGISGFASTFAGNSGGLGGMGQGIQNIAQGIGQFMKASDSVTASVGSATDSVDVLPTNVQLRFLEACPTLSECQRIDKFFDVFGYAQNTFGNVKNWFTNRSAWNYIKTTACKIRLNGNQSDLSTIKSIFDSGVTVWHSISGYGDYTQDNN